MNGGLCREDESWWISLLLPTAIAALRAYRQPQVVNFQGARRTLPDGSPYCAVVL